MKLTIPLLSHSTKLKNIKPYISHSRFFKDEEGYKDSERLIAGVYFNYKAIGIQGEYIMSKNDPMVGGGANGLAQGSSNDWDKLFYLSIDIISKSCVNYCPK